MFKYRKDIDGLRAIAVLLVVFYHAGFKVISGGFIGVDVFFVISGFLITTIIYNATQNGTPFFFNFYIKRIKRILPSFYVVILATLVFGYFILIPDDLVGLTKSILASSLFLANIYFWKTSGGYFTANTEELPLLHLWSLSVEEQFYFVWPLLLFFLVRTNSKRFIIYFTAVTITILLSFSEWAAINKPNAAYYFLPTRAGELLLGGLLSLIILNGYRIKKTTATILSYIGFLLIIIPSFFLSHNSVFPGINALYPCVGAAAIILSGHEHRTIIGSILSSKLFVFIGLISYPLYLWHWPIIAYINYLDYELNLLNGILAITLSIFLATFTWLFIEKNVKKIKNSNRLIFVTLFLIPLVVITVLFFYLNSSSGYKERFVGNEGYVKAKEVMVMPTTNIGWCYEVDNNYAIEEKCYLGNKKLEKSQSIFLGDSHAGHYQSLVNYIGIKSNLKISTFITSNCFPSLNFTDSSNFGGNPELCKSFRIKVNEMITDENINVVFLAAKWDENIQWLDETKEALDVFTTKVKIVFILPQVPIYEGNIAKDFLKSKIIKLYNSNALNKINESYLSANRELKVLASRYENVHILNTTQFLNNGTGSVSVSNKGIPLYFDNNHLNIYGSEELKDKFKISTESELLLEKIRLLNNSEISLKP